MPPTHRPGLDGTADGGEALLGARYRGATLGSFALVFLVAFESLAVATVMPVVTADLDGRAWFSVAFSSTLAASVLGMTAAGGWADRRGAARPLLASVALFATGLAVAGLAPTIGVLIAGRVLQGLGGGGLLVALYVLVAQVYDAQDRPRILGLFAAAWVLPGLVGPALAGVTADLLGWRWVFLGVVLVAAGAAAVLVPTLRGLEAAPADDTPRPVGARRAAVRSLALAAVTASAVMTLNLAGALGGPARAAVAVAAVVGALAALRPLLPPGTLVAARGLPAVVALRGLIAATFVAAEVYLPFLLQEQYDASPSRSGLVLTVATIAWALGSQVQALAGGRLRDERALALGALLLAVGMLAVLTVVLLRLPDVWIGVAWAVTASGMGLALPRTTAAVLIRSEARQRGSASSALTMSDAVGSAVGVAVVGLVFTAVGTAADLAAFGWVFACAATVALLAAAVARRV